MKYIRTEDGVYELKINEEDKKNNIVNYFYIDFSEHLRFTFDKKELRKYKQADTIEELCDAFIYHYINENRHEVYKELSNIPFVDRDIIKDGNEIIGGIFTDKGLIYVAKLNNKGELELL